MSLPTPTLHLADQLLAAVQADPLHHLRPSDRYRLYESFGDSRLFRPSYDEQNPTYSYIQYLKFRKQELESQTVADYAQSWLAILTARKVLPIWSKIKGQTIYTGPIPHDMLATAEDFVNNETPIDEIVRFSEEARYGSTEMQTATFEVSCAYQAAISVLYVVTDGLRGRGDNEMFVDDAVTQIYGDYACDAVKAYTALDPNKPGGWASWWMTELANDQNLDPEIKDIMGVQDTDNQKFIDEMQQRGIQVEGVADKYLDYQPITFDAQKRLEFWKWWLTEALPLAWQQAEETFANRW